MIKYILSFPWPYDGLSPNKRLHFAKKAKIKAKYRADCYLLANRYPRPIFEDGDIGITITFNPPSHRKYDLDNALASMKSGIDGIAEWWRIDDVRLNPITIKRGPVSKRASVEILLD